MVDDFEDELLFDLTAEDLEALENPQKWTAGL